MTSLLFDFPKKLIRVETVPKLIVMFSYALHFFPVGFMLILIPLCLSCPGLFIILYSTHFIFIIELCCKIRIHI